LTIPRNIVKRWTHWFWTDDWRAHVFEESESHDRLGHLPQATRAVCGAVNHAHEPINIVHTLAGQGGAWREEIEQRTIRCAQCDKVKSVWQRRADELAAMVDRLFPEAN
jgi:hypothetical protein